MNALTTTGQQGLPALFERARQALAAATGAADVLEARDFAAFAYDAAKASARLMRAKGAHDELIAAAHRVQADALEIEAQAKRRLADEYDAAQERGEVASGRPKSLPDGKTFAATVTDIGLTHKQVHEARQLRDAEAASPGLVERTNEARLAAGQRPTMAAIRAARGAHMFGKRKKDEAQLPALTDGMAGYEPVELLTTEVAELTGKRHDHVMRDVRKVLEELHGEDAHKFGAITHDAYGREKPCFRLPERELLVLLPGYSITLRAKVLDRMRQLEAERRHANVMALPARPRA